MENELPVITDSKSMLMRRRVLVNTISNYAGKVTTLVVGFFMTPFILRQLGATIFGLWAVIGSIVAYGALLDFGIESAITKYVAEFNARGEFDQASSLVTTALWLYSGIGLLAIALSVVLAFIFPLFISVPENEHEMVTWLLILSGLNLGISFPCIIPWAIFRGLQRFDLINLLSTAGTLLVSGATIVVLLLGGGLLGMVAVNIPLTILMQIPAVWLIRRIAPDLRLSWRGFNRQLVRRVASYSSSLFLINISSHLQTRTNEIVIGAFLPLVNVTPYAIARRLSEMAQLLTDQFAKLVMPLASQLHAESDQASLRALYKASTRLSIAIFLPIGGGAAILAEPFMARWVGPAYSGYAYLVLILTGAYLIGISQWPAVSVLQGMARHRLLALFAISSGILNVGLSIILLRPFGLAGVALAALITAVIEGLFLVLPYTLRTVGIDFQTVLKEVFLPALIPAVPMVIVLYGLKEAFQLNSLLSIGIVAIAGLLVYVGGYLLIGASKEERASYRDFTSHGIEFARKRIKSLKSGATD